MSRCLWLIVVLCGPLVLRAQDAASPPPGAIEPAAVNLGRPVDFDKDIVPIFDGKCVACHNVAIAESRLNLEDVPAILKGGKRGPAVVPKEPDKSLLYKVAARAVEPVMPPLPNKVSATPLTPQELGLLRQWILEGAPAGAGSSPTTITWQPIPPHIVSIYGVAVTTWGRFAACGRANQIDVYDLVLGEHVARLTDPLLATLKQGDKPLYPHGAAHQDFVHAVAFHPQRHLLASAGYREVKFWERPEQVLHHKLVFEAAPTAVAVSPDGAWLAVAGADQQIRLVQRNDGQVVRSWGGHTAAVTALQFSSDGQKLLSGSQDKTLRLWNVTDGQPMGQLTTPHEVLCLVWSADGKVVYTGHPDQTLRGWAVPFETPQPAPGDQPAEPVKPVVQIQGLGGAVMSLAPIPGQAQLACGSQDGNWRIVDATNGNQIRSGGHGAPITSLAVSPDGQFFATAGGNVARLWNINGQQLAELKGSIAAQRTLQLLTDDDAVAKSRVALADAAFKAAEKNFKEREEQTKQAQQNKANMEKALAEAREKEKAAADAAMAAQNELNGKPDDEGLKKKKAEADAALAKEKEAAEKAQTAFDAAAKALAQAEKGQQLAAEQQDAARKTLEAEQAAAKAAEERLNASQSAIGQTEKAIQAVVFVDHHRLATAGADGVVRTWHAKTGKPLDEWNHHQGTVIALAAGPARTLVSAGEDRAVLVWDADPPWRYVGVLGPRAAAPLDLSPSPFVGRVLALAFSPDGRWLATGGGEPSRSGELFLWEVETRSFVRSFPDAHSDTVFSVEFSRDGKWLVSGAADKFVKLHEVETGKLLRSFEGHTHHVLGVSLKADGSRIASAGADNAIKIWNVETGEQHRTIQNYSKQVTSIRFIGVSDNIVSGSGDKSIKFHRANDGGNYRSFGGPTDYVHSTCATRDEGLVLAGGEDGVLRVWNGQNGQLLFSFEPPKPPADSQQAQVP